MTSLGQSVCGDGTGDAREFPGMACQMIQGSVGMHVQTKGPKLNPRGFILVWSTLLEYPCSLMIKEIYIFVLKQ